MSYSSKLREASDNFLKKNSANLKHYQEYKNNIIRILDNLTPGELVDLAINITKGRAI